MYSCNTIYVLCMYNNITPRVRGSYEMADSQRGAVGCNHLISNKCMRNNCFIKNLTNYRKFFLTFFVKTTDFQLVFILSRHMQLPYLESMHGIMAHIP